FGIFSTIPAAESRSTIRNAVEGFTSSNSAIRARLLGPCPSSTTSIRYCGSVKLSSTAANERAAIATNNRDAVSNSPTTRSLAPSTSGRALHDPGMHTFLPATTTTPPHPCPMQQPHHPPQEPANRGRPGSAQHRRLGRLRHFDAGRVQPRLDQYGHPGPGRLLVFSVVAEQFAARGAVVAGAQPGQRGDQRGVGEQVIGPGGRQFVPPRIVGLPIAGLRPALDQGDVHRIVESALDLAEVAVEVLWHGSSQGPVAEPSQHVIGRSRNTAISVRGLAI